MYKIPPCVCVWGRGGRGGGGGGGEGGEDGVYGRPKVQDHYENTPIQKNFQMKNSCSFHISAQNIDWGYLL